MACDQFDNLIVEYCEGSISPDARRQLESHMAACADCRAFLAIQKNLDARLTRAIVPPQVPANFKRRVLVEIEARPEKLRFTDFAEALDWFGYSSLALAALYLLGQSPNPALYAFWIAIVGGIGFGLWEARHFIRDFSL